MAVGTEVLINIELRFIDISIIFIFSSNKIRRMEMKKKKYKIYVITFLMKNVEENKYIVVLFMNGIQWSHSAKEDLEQLKDVLLLHAK